MVWLFPGEIELLLILNGLGQNALQASLVTSYSAYVMAPLIFFLALISGDANWRERRKRALLAAVAMIIAVLLVTGIKYVVAEPRPPEVLQLNILDQPDVRGDLASSSFPSRHAGLAFAAAAAWQLFVVGKARKRKHSMRATLTIIFYIWAALIAISRIILGVHWPHDVVAGAIFGVGSALLIKFLANRLRLF